MNSSNRLFYRSKFRLAIAYASVMGATLLLCGFVAHFFLEKSFKSAVNRELEILDKAFDQVFNDKLKFESKRDYETVFKEMSSFLKEFDCLTVLKKSDNVLQKTAKSLVMKDCPTLSNNYTLSQNVQDFTGKVYHLHLLKLNTNSGEIWVQVGRKLEHEYMNKLHLLGLIIPFAMVLIGVASWYLAGLAMFPIQQSYEQMQRFTSDVSHELRTPIATIQTILETTLDNPLFLDHQQSLKSIYRQIKRLGNLTADLLLLSRLEQNPLQDTKWQKICLNDLVQDVEEELMSMAISVHISLSCDLQTEDLLYIHGNEGQIYRLLINLVTNSIKYTPENGEVFIILKAESSQAIIIVKDTGIGISQNDIFRIFERFYRVNDDRSRHTGGTGLGLAIAKAIALSHEGNLQVESSLGEGSSFIVSLPLLLRKV